MDKERAHQLLGEERERLEQALAALTSQSADAAEDQDEPGDRGSQDLYEKERDEGRGEDLAAQLESVKRAEARLADGTYGLSVDSGLPIPDARLEAQPAAERTVEEQQALDG